MQYAKTEDLLTATKTILQTDIEKLPIYLRQIIFHRSNTQLMPLILSLICADKFNGTKSMDLINSYDRLNQYLIDSITKKIFQINNTDVQEKWKKILKALACPKTHILSKNISLNSFIHILLRHQCNNINHFNDKSMIEIVCLLQALSHLTLIKYQISTIYDFCKLLTFNLHLSKIFNHSRKQ